MSVAMWLPLNACLYMDPVHHFILTVYIYHFVSTLVGKECDLNFLRSSPNSKHLEYITGIPASDISFSDFSNSLLTMRYLFG